MSNREHVLSTQTLRHGAAQRDLRKNSP